MDQDQKYWWCNGDQKNGKKAADGEVWKYDSTVKSRQPDEKVSF